MKKVLLIFSLLAMLVAFPVAADESTQVYVNGNYVGEGVLINDTTYVPVRLVSENLGAKVDWDGAVWIDEQPEQLQRPVIVGDEEFVTMVNAALDLLQEKDFLHYATVCQLGWSIERRDKSPMFKMGVASIEVGHIVIYDLLVNSKRLYNPQYLAGTLVHESSHAVGNNLSNWTEIGDPKLGEKMAYANELTAFKLIDAPQWMQDECIGWESRY